MASGYGLNGGPGRCFPFWQELLACYVVNTSNEDDSGKLKCVPALEDYYECLHHKKEHARVAALQTAYRKAEERAGARDDAPTLGQIRSLGLINKEEETKKMLGR
ncbi:hypothetical protein P8C59_001600 [Phyllachora maydis]|uniref:NADH dehydrogenase [ubiquinone] iron-sulfur protein 5 n=1 Tax=Phyllachora maydis TaxID=1825666 RepID=A0AAD9HZQ5_9PEZI|nr:hypothetical protein P8C59_001600 [Phyllachora maydis]